MPLMLKRLLSTDPLVLCRRGVRTLRRRRKWLIYLGGFAAALTALLLLWPIDIERYLDGEASAEIHDRADQPLYVFLNNQQQWCFPKTLNQVNPHLVQATLAAEDHRFWSHHGVDPLAFLRAFGQLLLHGRAR